MKRAPSCERCESSVGGLIEGEHQGLIVTGNEGEMFSLDHLHRTELHLSLVSCLEPSDRGHANVLQPLPFLLVADGSKLPFPGVARDALPVGGTPVWEPSSRCRICVRSTSPVPTAHGPEIAFRPDAKVRWRWIPDRASFRVTTLFPSIQEVSDRLAESQVAFKFNHTASGRFGSSD
jgi:hypothetical protein